MTADRGPLVLVDAHGYLHRAYHALPPLNNSRGEPVGALFGFARMLLKILKNEEMNLQLLMHDFSQETILPAFSR
jgi:DNA polymerase-1